MDQAHKTSFRIVLALVFLLPVFFIPGGALSLTVAKAALLAFGVITALLVFLFEVWQVGKFDIVWHPLFIVVLLLPLVYLFSALLTTPSALSLFGYNFEVGTFGFMLLGSVLLMLIGTIFTDTSKVLQVLAAFFISITLVAVFAAIKILSSGDTANPIGRWTDLATVLGLLSVFSILVLGMIPMRKSLRLLAYGVFGLSTILLVVVNFSTAFIFTLGASVVLFVYFSILEKRFGAVFKSTFTLPIILGVVSLLFLINPTISSRSGTLGEVVTDAFKIENVEIRPSLSTTLSVSRRALSQNILLGSGPNTFSHDWLIYKPAAVNTTPFWGIAFPFGIGFIPTQVASTGIFGMILWTAFFALLIFLGIKALARIPESRALRFALVSSFITLLYLWITSFIYPPSFAMLMLTFVFSGLFVAACRQVGVISSRLFVFSQDTAAKLISTSLIVLLAIGSLALGFVAFEKTASAFYFKKAVDLANTPGTALDIIETALDKAVKFAPADIHYVAISRINLARAQTAATDTSASPEENLAVFEGAIAKSISAARSAVSVNPSGYQNWITLGQVYSFLVPAPLAVAGAYENAVLAYSEAEKRNPLSPEVPLFLARLELYRSDAEAARSFIRQSLALKEDYADAYLMLAQLEIQENNIEAAIASAERLALLIPGNPNVYFELGLLKYSNQDYPGAADAFALAIATVPDYANAKYYLGLSLVQLGHPDEAREQFEALLVDNPDNEELKEAIENLND